MNRREKAIHVIWYFLEMRREMIPYINWLFAIAAAELSDIRNGRRVQGPKRVFVEGLDTFFKANLYAVRQEVILPQKVLLLNFREQRWIVFLSDRL